MNQPNGQDDVYALFAAHAAMRPTAAAVSFDGNTLTYGELLARVEHLADALRTAGVGRESVVGIRLQRGHELVIAMLAVLRAGAAYLPLDVSVPLERAQYMLRTSETHVLLATPALAEGFATDSLAVFDVAQMPAAGSGSTAAQDVHPEQLAYVLYTSGSTGKPKGVQISRGALANAIASFAGILGATPRDVFLSVTGISFDIFELELLLPLSTGGLLVLADRDRLLEPGYLAGLATVSGASLFQTTPTLARNLLDTGWKPDAALRILIGGEALTPELAARLADAQAVYNVYGPTEATIWVSSDAARPAAAQVIGTALQRTQLHILDARLDACAVGDAGELYIAGVQLARGYANRPDLTAERFIPNPFAPGDRLYRTGDLARWNDDGTIEYLGRADQQVKLRGYRIELGEIDAAIEADDAVSSAVTVLREDVPGNPMLVSYYTVTGEWLDKGPDAQLSTTQTAAWEDIYDDKYATEGTGAGNGDQSVWIDSRSGASYPARAMQEWIDTTVERIAGFGARRVLEIGCGSGQLLLRLAADVERYVGTDLSAQALSVLAAKTRGMSQVALHVLPADRTRELAAERFDLVVLNSVAQYFPGERYLRNVLEQAAALLAPGGRLFVGDVRNKALLPAFYAAVERGLASTELSRAQLLERIEQRARAENELCLDPRFFAQLAQAEPFASVQLLARRGNADTEMNNFRFDAVLRTRGGRAPQAAPVERIVQWDRHEGTAADMLRIAASLGGAPLRVSGIPDLRTWSTFAMIGDARARPQPGFGLHPDRVLDIARQADVSAVVEPSNAAGTFDVVLLPHDMEDGWGAPAPACEDPQELATRPLLREMVRALEAGVRADLERELPAYMVPSVLLRVDRFPLNTSGKLDRNALPRPAFEEAAAIDIQDEVQAAVGEAMAEVLGLAHAPGPQGDFFNMGGHSLAAVRLAARLRERFGNGVDLHAVFELRTVARLAAHIEGSCGATADRGIALTTQDYPAGTRVALSRGQQSLWFLDRLDGASALYNMAYALRIAGDVDRRALETALARLVERHVPLRTVCVEADGQPVGVVQYARVFELPIDRIAGDDDPTLVERARAAFDLGRDSMLRAHLFRCDTGGHVLLLVVHHIAADGMSMAVLGAELAKLYEEAAGGAPAGLAPLAAQYPDFAAWQRDCVAPEEVEKQLAWWRHNLQDVPTTLELPLDKPRPMACAHRGSAIRFDVPAPVRAAVERVATSTRASAFSVLLGAFGGLLQRLAGQDEVVVGVATGGRRLRQFEGLVGLFANVLPVRMDAMGDATTAQYAGATSAALNEALARQDVSFDQLVDHLGIERALDRMPLVQAVFTYLDDTEELALGNLATQSLDVHLGTARFDLTLQMGAASGGGWRGLMEFDADLFDAATISRWCGHFVKLLEGAVTHPDRALAEVALEEPGQAARRSAAPATLAVQDFVEALEAQCRARPDATAVVCGRERLTFAALDARARRIAASLRARGVVAGDVVALHIERSSGLLAAMWGVLKLGAAFLPLDKAVPQERRAYMLETARARLMVTDAAELTGAGCEVAALDQLLRDGVAGGAGCRPVARAAAAYVIFTSGSTGLPKGVEVSRDAFSAFSAGFQQALGLEAEDVGASIASIAFDMFLSEVLPVLCAGACVVLADRERLLENAYLGDLLAAERVTLLTATPSLLGALTGGGWMPAPELRLITGGEAIQNELAEKLAAGGNLWNGYGPTEAACAQTLGRIRLPLGIRPAIGAAFGLNELFVLDARLNPVPPGVVGELYIGGRQLANGYCGRADLTAERFIPSPFHSGQRLYRTGDLARWRADGQLEHCGRSDGQVKIRGHRIELGEIEGRILEYAGVAAAAVVAREDTPGNKQLVGYVVGREGHIIDLTALAAQLARHLPPYMVPARLVPLARLPMTRNGKLDTKALPAPDWMAAAVADPVPACSDPLQVRIAALMADVLGLAMPVASGTSFFDAGGHSLAAVRLIARMREEFGADVPLRTFFEEPTAAGLARRLQDLAAPCGSRSPFVSFGNGSADTPLFMVHGADGYAINFRHLGKQLAPRVHLYGIDCAHAWLPADDADGLDVAALARLYADRLIAEFPQLHQIRLGGWSFGGLVALEMARYLRSRRREVIVFAVDSAMNGAAQDLLGAIGTKAGVETVTRRHLLEAGHTEEEVGTLFNQASLNGAVGDLYAAFASHVSAAGRYVPAPYAGDFTLIMAEDGLGLDADSQERWRNVIGGALDLRTIPGGHLSILREPAVAALADKIEACIGEAAPVGV